VDNNGKELTRRGDRLFTKRDGLASFWQASAELYYPVRANFTSQLEWGESFASQLMESSPVLFHRDLSNAFSSMMRPRGSSWFALDLDDENLRQASGVREWLDSRTQVMRRHLYRHRAQFVKATKEADHDFAGFGNAVLSVEKNDDLDGLLFRCHHLKDCAWVENQYGEVDTMFRNLSLSARQMEQRWEKADLHANIKKACQKDPDKEFTIRHVMMPAKDYEYVQRKRAPKGAEFVSIYVDTQHNQLITEAPAYEFRYVVPRWQSIPGSQYGYSPPVLISLPDARGIQVMARVLLEAGEKAVDPPVVATAEAVIGEINLQASGITWVDREYDEGYGQALRPLELNNKNLAVGVNLLDRTREAMKEAWYLNKLSLPQQGAKTAFETAQLVEEFIRSSIPLFEPMETAYNAPLLDMAASILLRNGAFGDPNDMPEELRGKELIFSFANPLQEAIEKNKVFQFQSAAGIAAQAMQADPSAKHDFNIRKAARDAIEGSGAPADWLVDQKEADENAQAEMEAMQAAQDVQKVGMAGAAAEQVGKAGQALVSIPGMAA
jgi:hypothetical protein